jgi:hypothetical protein
MGVSFAILYDKRKEITGHQYTNAEIDEHDKTVYHHRMSALFENLKMSNWYIIQFYPIFMLRRTLYVFLLIFGGHIDWLQMNMFILLVAMVSLYQLIIIGMGIYVIFKAFRRPTHQCVGYHQ